MIVVHQPVARESQIALTNNTSNGLTAASGQSFTLKFTTANTNATPSASGGTNYTIVWGDGGTNTASATSGNATQTPTAQPTHTYATAGRYQGRIETSTNDSLGTKGTTYFTVVVAS